MHVFLVGVELVALPLPWVLGLYGLTLSTCVYSMWRRFRRSCLGASCPASVSACLRVHGAESTSNLGRGHVLPACCLVQRDGPLEWDTAYLFVLSSVQSWDRRGLPRWTPSFSSAL